MANTASMNAITREKFIPVLVDNIFNSNPLNLKLLKNAEKLDGGRKIITPIETVMNTQQAWIASGGSTFRAADGSAGGTEGTSIETFTKAEWDWKTAFGTIVIEGDTNYMNMGSSQVISLLKSKVKNAEKSLKDLFGTSLFDGTVSADEITAINGANHGGTSVLADLQAHDNGNGIIHDFAGHSGTSHHVPQGGLDNTIVGYQRSLGGIDSDHNDGTNDYWNAKLGSFEWAIGTVGGAIGGTALANDGSNDTGAMSFSNFTKTENGVAAGVRAMTQMYGALTIDNDQPDLIVTTQVIFDAYESSLQANKRFDGDATLADAGFQSLRFKGATVVVDSHVPDGHMYFLNTDYLDFKVHSKRNFAFEDFKTVEYADKMQSRIFWMGNLVCTNPRMQGMLAGGPTGY